MSEARPKVSVVLCCYNQESFVRDAIDSVLRQTYSPIELIAIDNGSTDTSAAILKEYENDPRVAAFLHKENKAVTLRLNEGIRAATGEYISILYADDYFLPRKMELQMDWFSKLSNDYGVVYSPGLRKNVITGKEWQERSITKSGDILESMLTEFHKVGFINPVSPLVRKQCFLDFPFRESVFIEGEAIYFRIASKYKFQFCEEPLVVMRDHLGNAGKAIKKTKTYVESFIQLWLKDPAFPERYRPHVKKFLARVLRNYGWQSLRLAEDPRWARECFLEAFKWDFHQALHPRVLFGTGISFLPQKLLSLANHAGNLLKHSDGLRKFNLDNR